MGRVKAMRRSRNFFDRRMSSEESDEDEEDSMQLKLYPRDISVYGFSRETEICRSRYSSSVLLKTDLWRRAEVSVLC
jgi:hypothetical protein